MPTEQALFAAAIRNTDAPDTDLDLVSELAPSGIIFAVDRRRPAYANRTLTQLERLRIRLARAARDSNPDASSNTQKKCARCGHPWHLNYCHTCNCPDK